MIAHLRGRLLSKDPSRIILEAGGIGYEVFIPVSTFYELGEVGAEAGLHIYTHVREDTLSLYGFHTPLEKSLFARFLEVSGVGPRLALTILSGLEIEELVPAIQKGDIARLVRIPGVGRKTAERLVVELREKLAAMVPPQPERREAPVAKPGAVEEDALSALINLGYARYAAENALREVSAENPQADFEHLLRGSLRLLARKFFS